MNVSSYQPLYAPLREGVAYFVVGFPSRRRVTDVYRFGVHGLTLRDKRAHALDERSIHSGPHHAHDSGAFRGYEIGREHFDRSIQRSSENTGKLSAARTPAYERQTLRRYGNCEIRKVIRVVERYSFVYGPEQMPNVMMCTDTAETGRCTRVIP